MADGVRTSWKQIVIVGVVMIFNIWSGCVNISAETPPAPPGAGSPETGEEYSNASSNQSSSSAGAAEEGGTAGKPEETPGNATADAGADTGKKKRDEAMKIAEQCKLFGKFTYDAGTVFGRFVEFNIDEATGMISAYTIKRSSPLSSIEVFESVTIAEFVPTSSPRVEGAVFIYNDSNLRLRAHNNPPGVLHYVSISQPNMLTFSLAEGLTAEMKTNTTVSIVGNELSAILVTGNSELIVSERTIEVNLSVGASALFRAIPRLGVSIWHEKQAMLCDAIAAGNLGAELSLIVRAGTWVEDHIPYLNVDMKTIKAEQGRVKIEVSSTLDEGKVVVINIDMESIELDAIEELEILYDGAEVPLVEDIDVVLECTAATIICHISVSDDSIVQIFIYIPGFSTHIITLQKTIGVAEKEAVDERAPQFLIPGFDIVIPLVAFGIAIFIAGAVGWYNMYRRRFCN